MSDILTVDEIAQHLKIPKSAVYRMVERHEIPCVRLGRLIRFRTLDIEDWLSKKVNSSPTKCVKSKDVAQGNAMKWAKGIVDSLAPVCYSAGSGKPNKQPQEGGVDV